MIELKKTIGIIIPWNLVTCLQIYSETARKFFRKICDTRWRWLAFLS
uniref:Uncharacterized protein n=1 Tax=Arundo donax TaxID=35708 RepID=A0A0A8ZEW8_ARUDO